MAYSRRIWPLLLVISFTGSCIKARSPYQETKHPIPINPPTTNAPQTSSGSPDSTTTLPSNPNPPSPEDTTTGPNPNHQTPNYHLISWVALTRPWTLNLITQYLEKIGHEPLKITPKLRPEEINNLPDSRDALFPDLADEMSMEGSPNNFSGHVRVVDLPINPKKFPNPLRVMPSDFDVGGFLPWPLNQKPSAFPMPNTLDTRWFEQQVRLSRAPQVFVIGGHHVISEGFHNQAETQFLYEPLLFKLADENKNVRSYFDGIKLAILWGCNTLTVLEPHNADGSLMAPKDIKNQYEASPVSRQKILGTPKVINSMEFYKNRLATEYGPGTHEYAYTRSPQKEDCGTKTNPYYPCNIANLERILPDTGLFDGSHRYNEAQNMRKLFRNAYLVLGFASASPPEELRVRILQSAITRANAKLRLPKNENVIELIVNAKTNEKLRRDAVSALRDAWELESFNQNRHRPAGSITPLYPDIDNGYVSHLRLTNDLQINGKYRD